MMNMIYYYNINYKQNKQRELTKCKSMYEKFDKTIGAKENKCKHRSVKAVLDSDTFHVSFMNVS